MPFRKKPATRKCRVTKKGAPPAGAKFRKIRLQIGAPAPADPAKMEALAMENRASNRNDFDPGDAGKTAYYALRWITQKGELGPRNKFITRSCRDRREKAVT